tara:strand:- start:31701 stop:31979 length:279 start_codon:yes stop_codon:yes gene_type:complete
MPINIYKEENQEKLAWLCEELWDLPNQIDALETWLKEKVSNLKPNKYIADIGFEIRDHASGGGGILSSEAMKIMGKIGMNLYFSEYPNSNNL